MKECREFKFLKSEIDDEHVQKRLWEISEATVQSLEKEGAMRRVSEKKAEELKKKSEEKAQAKTTFVASGGSTVAQRKKR